MIKPTAHKDSGPTEGETLPPKGQDLSADKLFALAVYYQNSAEAEKALQYYQEAIAADQNLVAAYYNSGVILYGQSHWDAAIQYFKHALALQPDFLDAAYNLAAAYKEAGQYPQAAQMYQKVIIHNPNIVDASFYLGICHLKLGQIPPATEAFQQAVQLDPSNSLYWFHLAEAHFMIKSFKDAISCFQKAISLNPDWDSAHYNLAVALRMEQHLGDAIAHLKQAININPYFSQAHALLFRLAQHTCDWPLAAEMDRLLSELTPAELAKGMKCAESPMTNIRRTADARLNSQVAASWSRHTARQVAAFAPPAPFAFTRDTQQRIRIGYLSNDFKNHAVAHQIRGMLIKHNRHKFEIFGYATNPDDGTAYRNLLASACDHFRELHHLSDSAAAQQIHADGIQILVDMAGHSRNNRMGILALRPAPIQASYLGFLSSTGADFIDYVIADALVIPEHHQRYYTENIVYLPHCYQANDDQMTMAEQKYIRSDFNLPSHGVIYCSFNQPYKINKSLFRAWLSILQQVDDSVLWLVERSPIARENLCLAAKRADINPNRLIFTGFMPTDSNLARLQLADLVLDTLIYNGGATTSNALWAGVPVLTVLGEHWVSRMSASALMALGLPELVTDNLKDYTAKAVHLATDRSALMALRNKLANHRKIAPLFNTAMFTQHMESAYTRMVERYMNNQKPTTFNVDPI